MRLFTGKWCSGCKIVKDYIESCGAEVEIIDVDDYVFGEYEAGKVRALPTLEKDGKFITGVQNICKEI